MVKTGKRMPFALVMHDENGNMQEISVPAKGEAVLELI